MPVPLAHPAAVLLCRRWYPRYLDLAALVVGSLVPDLACSVADLEYFSHTLLGSFVFCLPAGLLTVWILQQIRDPLIATLPKPHRDVFLSFRPWRSVPRMHTLFSLFLGTWSHDVWDLFTHDHSWLVRGGLLSPYSISGIPVNRIFWFVSSLLGSTLVITKYLVLVRKQIASSKDTTRPEYRAYVFWLWIVTIPIGGALSLTFLAPTYSHASFPALCCYGLLLL